MTKAIFLDIDGTLVSMSTHQIPQSAVAALQKAKSNGLKIFIATGRPTSLINNIDALQSLHLIDGYITTNGAYCIVNDEIISRNTMSAKQVQTILHYSQKNNISCAVIMEERSAVYHPTKIFEEIFYGKIDVAPMAEIRLDEIIRKTENSDSDLLHTIIQLSPFIHVKHEDALRSLIPECEFNRWHDAFVDIGANGSTKAKGIDTIAQHFGFDISETVAIGDGGNDIPMIQHAGIGVAMGNAAPHIQSIADYVSTHIDDNGIENALKHIGVI